MKNEQTLGRPQQISLGSLGWLGCVVVPGSSQSPSSADLCLLLWRTVHINANRQLACYTSAEMLPLKVH